MKITIDTKQDSRDEIRKIVRLLNELLEMKHDNPPAKSMSQCYGDNYGHNYNSNYNSTQNNPSSNQYPHQNVQGYNTYGSSDFQNQTSSPVTNSMNPDSRGFFNMFDETPVASTTGMPGEQVVKTEDVEKKKADPAEFEIYEY